MRPFPYDPARGQEQTSKSYDNFFFALGMSSLKKTNSVSPDDKKKRAS